uniref:BTB domain-containing protein n=1 Tax=Pyramimonas obovata TaxID=1411642 RepID=A0A7S0WUK5_9CHLO|mmetsp:Transcript_495/g.1091  ORF Transcript_495/g.1091 Transcript_495/m.1091 type:complete len:674 (+) Transcript_495:206-2227(+)
MTMEASGTSEAKPIMQQVEQVESRARLMKAEAEALRAEHELQRAKRLKVNPPQVTLRFGNGRTIEVSRDTLVISPVTRMLIEDPKHDKEESYFLDRDPDLFEQVLCFLRYGEIAVSILKDVHQRERLAKEALYYQLPQLESMCKVGWCEERLPPIDREALMEARRVREVFVRAHQAEVAGLDTPPDVQDPFLGLEDLYEFLRENKEAQTAVRRKRVVESEDEREFLGLDRAGPWDLPQDEIVVEPKSHMQFQTALNKATGDILVGLPEEHAKHLVLAGGAVLNILQGSHCPRLSPINDVDLFIHGCPDEERAAQIVNGVVQHVMNKAAHSKIVVIRSRTAITVCGGGNGLPILQVILRLHRSPAEVLATFDMAPCQFLFDLKTSRVHATQWAVRALQTRVNVLDPSRLPARPLFRHIFEHRVAKYADRGYAVLVPGLDRRLLRPLPEDEEECMKQGGLTYLRHLLAAGVLEEGFSVEEGAERVKEMKLYDYGETMLAGPPVHSEWTCSKTTHRRDQDPQLGCITLHMPSLEKPETRDAEEIKNRLKRHYFHIMKNMAKTRMHPAGIEIPEELKSELRQRMGYVFDLVCPENFVRQNLFYKNINRTLDRIEGLGSWDMNDQAHAVQMLLEYMPDQMEFPAAFAELPPLKGSIEPRVASADRYVLSAYVTELHSC